LSRNTKAATSPDISASSGWRSSAAEGARRNRLIEQDLDVDFVIRGVDPGRCVDGIGVDAPAGEGERDASALGYREVAPSPMTFCPDLAAVDTERIVGAVADLGLGLARGP